MVATDSNEGVIGVMENAQNLNKNRCNGCNDYTTPVPSTPVPQKIAYSAPLKKDEVKELYLKLRASGVDPSANMLRSTIGHGSLSTLQRYINEFNETYVKERLNEIEKMRVTDATIQQIIQDLTQICLKIKIKEDDEKIEALNSLVLKHNQDRSTSEELLTTKIDNANSQITALTLKIKEIKEKKSKLSLENNELKNQLGIMTQELITNKEKYSYLEGVTNLLKRGGSDPDCIDKLFDELKIKHKHAKGEN